MTFDPRNMIDIDKGLASDVSALDEIFGRAGRHPGPVVIHFHGGLVSEQAATTNATKDAPFYEEAGAFPIFPIWKTGIGEVLPEVLGRIAREKLFQILLDRIIGLAYSHVKNALGLRGSSINRTLGEVTKIQLERSANNDIGDFQSDFLDADAFYKIRNQAEYELTTMEERSLRRLIETDQELLQEIDAILDGAELSLAEETRSSSGIRSKQPPKESVADRDFLTSFREESETRGFGIQAGIAVIKIIARVIKRFIDGKDHGVHATAVEEILREVYGSYIGTVAWSTMQSYTVIAGSPGGASLAILERLAKLPDDQRILLVGHSAGAIFISNLMKAAAQVGFARKIEIIFLAPAVRAATFKQGIIDHPQQLATHANRLCFRTFTMSDELEKQDTLIRNILGIDELKWLYPRSLLYFISGILEGDEVDADLVGLQRFHSPTVWNANDVAVAATRNFLMPPGRISYSLNNGVDPKMRTNSRSHGGFGSFAPDANSQPTNTTMQSVATILKDNW